MMEIGRLCVKIAGRDAGKKCVIIEKIDDKHFLVDGQTRRRKCNIQHIEPLEQTFKLKDTSRESVKELFQKEMGIPLKDTTKKDISGRPRQQRKKKEE